MKNALAQDGYARAAGASALTSSAYAAAAAAAVVSLVAGLALVRAFCDGGGGSLLESVELDLRQAAATYVYLAIAGALLVPVAWALGRRAEELQRLVATDTVTGLWNRRQLVRRLGEELKFACRSLAPVAVAVLDVDGLGALNKRSGRQAGDRALRALADSLARSCGAGEFLARWGGDEIVVLLPGSDAAEAVALVDRVRVALRGHAPPAAGAAPPTFSAGVSDVDWTGYDAEALLRTAEAAMRTARNRGGDRVVATGTIPIASLASAPRAQAPAAGTAAPERARDLGGPL